MGLYEWFRFFAAWLLSRSPFGSMTLGFGRISRWYKMNNVYKYPVGQQIRIKCRNILGYGVNAHGIVMAHMTNRWGEDGYCILMTTDKGANWFTWSETGELPENTISITEREVHFKWNIERQFVPASGGTMFRKILFFAAILILSVVQTTVHAQEIRTLSRARHVFENSDCDATSTCSLLRAKFLMEDYSVMIEGEPNYGTRFVAQYETDSISALKDYVFVQFIKGCIYQTRLENGLVIPAYRNFRYGKGDVFLFDDWVLDSHTDDPTYASRTGAGRHDYMRWNTVPGSFARTTARFYKDEPPPTPSLYVTGYPSIAFVMNQKAQNISLRFRMCLFKSADVPSRVSGNTLGSAVPLVCYEWDSWFVYDHLGGTFQWPYGNSTSCPTEPFSAQ